jgi:hypothetical protein
MSYNFLWNDGNIEYIAQHDVTPDEFEEAFECGQDVDNRDEAGGHEARIGEDTRGRLLFVIFDDIDGIDIVPVNAFEIDEHKGRRS